MTQLEKKPKVRCLCRFTEPDENNSPVLVDKVKAYSVWLVLSGCFPLVKGSVEAN